MTEAPAHAILAASAAHRWLMCTPSAQLEATLPESTSTYAEEGTLAHEIGALKLHKYTEPMSTRTFNSRLKKLQEDATLYQDEMLRHTDTYLEYIKGISMGYQSLPYIAIEVRLDLTEHVPEGFGTADCIIIGGTVLHVIDLKYGKGVPVDAKGNPQMMLYALGALAKYSILYDITDVEMAIVQPRLDTISEWGLPADDLRDWGENIKPIALQAHKGEGEYVAGDHCRFCRARSTCRARVDTYTALEDFGKMKPPLISNLEVGEVLERALGLVQWVEDLKEYALTECLCGREVPGWKAVEGRAVRQWTDADAAFDKLKEGGVDEAMLYERRALTLAATEKLLGKPRFQELVASFVTTPPGKPALVQASDKREAITRQSASDDFGQASRGEMENGS